MTRKNKQTSLHLAYLNNKNNSKNIIKLLIDYGANDNILDFDNKKPSDYKNMSNMKNKSKNINLNNKNNIIKIKKK